MKKLLAVAALLAAGCLLHWAQASRSTANPQAVEPKQGDAKNADEKAILEAIYAYKEAFNRGDAKALADLYSEHAELVDDTGRTLQGREAIRKEFAGIFEQNPGAQLNIAVDWVRWLSNDSVIHHGAARVTRKDGTVVFSTYSAVYVKRDGKWLIGMVREIPAASEGTEARASNLEALAWLIGDWIEEDKNAVMRVSCHWSKNKTYLHRKFTVYSPDASGYGGFREDSSKVVLECTEMIGWDPTRGILRSWVFDSNGGFAEGIWLHKGDHWYVKSHGVTGDGKKSSATHILTPAGEDKYTFRSVNRSFDGQLQPNISEVVLRRYSSSSKK